jgi:hypothetical protein
MTYRGDLRRELDRKRSQLLGERCEGARVLAGALHEAERRRGCVVANGRRARRNDLPVDALNPDPLGAEIRGQPTQLRIDAVTFPREGAVGGCDAAQLDPSGGDTAVRAVDCCLKCGLGAFQHLEVVAGATDIDAHPLPPEVVERAVSDREPVVADLHDGRALRPALAQVAAL